MFVHDFIKNSLNFSKYCLELIIILFYLVCFYVLNKKKDWKIRYLLLLLLLGKCCFSSLVNTQQPKDMLTSTAYQPSRCAFSTQATEASDCGFSISPPTFYRFVCIISVHIFFNLFTIYYSLLTEIHRYTGYCLFLPHKIYTDVYFAFNSLRILLK